MGQNELADRNPFGTAEIRQIQLLMVIFSCLPPNSKLREVLEHALALPNGPWLSRITPASDASVDGLKSWLEELWVREGLTSDEQKLVAWQQSVENIYIAVRELKAIEQRMGLKLDISLCQEQHERGLVDVVSSSS